MSIVRCKQAALGFTILALGNINESLAEDDDRNEVEAITLRSDNGKFFSEVAETEESRKSTQLSGNLTLSTLYFAESGGDLDLGNGEIPPNSIPVGNASNVNRFFTDLRTRITAKHISGSNWDFHLDLRGRITPGSCSKDSVDTVRPCTRFQSGSFSGNEIDFNQFYFRRTKGKGTLTLGRQFVNELFYTKVDGVRYDRRLNSKWNAIGFAGLYPALISRDIRSDYPVLNQTSSSSPPIVAGGGASYRYKTIYGSFGGTAVVPLTNELSDLGNGAGGTGQREQPRFFVTSKGYWKVVPSFDIYHSAIIDATGAGGPGATNLAIGVNYRPNTTLRTYGQLTRVSTDILNVNAQTQLEAPGNQADFLQNNIAVQRIAQESLRGGVSAAFAQNRFEISTIVTARRRPSISLTSNLGNIVNLPGAQAADFTIHAVDRRSFANMRIAGSVSRTFGFGTQNLNRGNSLIFRLRGSRSFLDGKAELDGAITYLASQDETRLDPCVPANIEMCYGSAATTSLGLAVNGFYRFGESWFVLGGLNIANQGITEINAAANAVISVPSILMTTVYARLAYRF